jgi:hypothetical protein
MMTGEKIGPNDPCPCGSGRKYKHCCLGRETPAADAEMGALNEALGEALADGDFSSLEELLAEVDRFMAGHNAAPVADFHGLSRDQLYRCLYFPYGRA